MHNEILKIGSITIHGYGLAIGVGFIFAVILANYRGKSRGFSSDAVYDMSLLSLISGFAGGKLLYIIVEFPEFIKAPLSMLGSEGFVLYGGVIVAIIAVYLYCRKKRVSFLGSFDLLMPSVAIAQGFGRIGCYLAGCCYGRETQTNLGVIFPEGSLAPAGVKLLPTQLFSAGGDFIIAGILLIYAAKKSKHKGDVGALYLLLYSIGRFIIEFFRADYRGWVGPFSTAQFISIFILLISFVFFAFNRKREYFILEPEKVSGFMGFIFKKLSIAEQTDADEANTDSENTESAEPVESVESDTDETENEDKEEPENDGSEEVEDAEE